MLNTDEEDSNENKPQSNSGSARFGNFTHYYNFHPAENRIRLLPNYSMYVDNKINPLLCLDVGCNTGELSQALYRHLEKCMKNEETRYFLSIDFDQSLISRANELNKNDHITFLCLDVLSNDFNDTIVQYLNHHGHSLFDIIYCFSVTMWIHLNHGDEGLRQLITRLSHLTKLLVIEPQPWKCYGKAVRRMKRTNNKPFEEFSRLRIRKDIESYIEKLIEECNLIKVLQTAPSSWGRQVSFYKKKLDDS